MRQSREGRREEKRREPLGRKVRWEQGECVEGEEGKKAYAGW